MSITLDECESQIKKTLDAISKVKSGQQYSVGSRSLTRANLKDLHKDLEYWRRERNAILTGVTGSFFMSGVPR